MGHRNPSTRTVSLVFTDLVGSTALANELGGEPADALRRDHLRTLDRLIERAGGQSVKSLGDGVMAVFGSARQAIDCAISMQRMMRATGGQQRRTMAMRIGISCGDALFEHEDYHGRPVVEAARLCAAARGGQILATDLTGRMASGLVGAEITPIVPMQLKGIEEPVPVVEVAWADAVGGESVGIRAADQPLLERDRELDLLAGAVAAARAGHGVLVLIEGPAGIGKTRLLARGADAGTTSGMLVLRAHGAELEQDYSWGVVRQLFERWMLDQAPDERGRLLIDSAEPALAVLGRGGSVGDRDPFAIVHGLYWLAVNAADGSPLALVVDDAQWADEASLRWLTYLAARGQQLPLALLIAVRRPDPAADREPLQRLEAERSAQILHPMPLSPDATRELVAQRPRLANRPELAVACHAASGGNPFLLGALLDDLSEQAIEELPTPDGVRAIRPAEITRSVLLRLGRLSPEARSLARAFAILGGSATTARAAMLIGVEAPDPVNAISALVTAGILRDSAPPAFVHPVIHSVVLEDMRAAERASLHARAAVLLRESGAEIQEVAAQLLQAEPAADSVVVQTLREAARAALAEGAPEAAAALLQRAVREPPPASERHVVQRLLGRALIRGRGAAGLAPLRAAVEAAPDPRARAEAAIELAAALEGLSRNTEATAVYAQALRDISPTDDPLVDTLEAALAVAASQHLSTLPRALEALAAMSSRQPDEGGPNAVTRAVMAVAAAAAGNPEGVAMARAALADGELFEADTSVAIGMAIAPLVWGDRLDEALSAWDEVIERARRHGAPLRFAFAITYRAQVYLRSGRLVDAEADARAALEVPDEMWVASVPVDTVALLAEALIDRGDLDEAEKLLAPAGPGSDLSDYLGNNLLLMARGRLRLTQGRAAEAADDLLELGRRCEAWTLRNPAAFPWRSHAALALSHHDRQRAIALAEEELGLAAAFGAPRALGISLRAAGLVEHGPGGLRRLREAVHVLDSSPAVLERARTLIALGGAERRAGERSRARNTLAEGLDAAAACGAHALVERARAELRAAGARPRRDRITGRDALTASELRVARLATEGKTNREIAEALWVTLSTVETHLTRVYRKLDIAERSELEEALQSALTPEPSSSTSRPRPVINQSPSQRKGSP
jgi:class 3 adenylate cyclase/DNA-binding CsgD family transcriptional regulator